MSPRPASLRCSSSTTAVAPRCRAGVAVFASLNALNLLWLVKLVKLVRAQDAAAPPPPPRQPQELCGSAAGGKPAAGGASAPEAGSTFTNTRELALLLDAVSTSSARGAARIAAPDQEEA